MSMLDVDALRRLPGAMSPEEAGRFTPQPTDNPYGELDNEIKAQPAQAAPEGKIEKTSAVSPYDDLDKELAGGPGDQWLASHLPEFMAKGIRNSPQAADIGTLGSGGEATKEVARALVRGSAAGSVGAGALLLPTQSGWGLKDIATGNPEAAFDKANRWLKGTGTSLPPDASTLERLVYGGATMIPGTLLPIAMGGAVLPAVAGTLAGPLAGSAAEGIAGAAGVPENFKPFAGLIGGVLGGGGAGGVAERALERMRAPTSGALINEATKGYDKLDNMPVTFHPEAVASRITEDIAPQMRAGGSDFTAKTVFNTLNALRRTSSPDGSIPLGQLRGVQKNLKGVAQETDNMGNPTANSYWATQTVKSIDKFLEESKSNPQWAIAGKELLPDISSTLKEANGNYAAGMRSQDFIDNLVTRPSQSISSTYTMGNSINQTRQAAKWMLDPRYPHRIAGWDDGEVAGLNQILHGLNPVQNLMRLVGRLAPDNALGLWGALGGTGMALTGNPAGLVGPTAAIAGIFARKLGASVQKRQINNLDKKIRLRSPLGQSMNAEPSAGEMEGAEGAGGVAGFLGEKLPEGVHHGAQMGADISRKAMEGLAGQPLGETDEDEKKKGGGGYAMGTRLLKAVGGYDGSFFRGGYGMSAVSPLAGGGGY